MGSWECDVLCESDNHMVGILAVFRRRALLYGIWQQKYILGLQEDGEKEKCEGVRFLFFPGRSEITITAAITSGHSLIPVRLLIMGTCTGLSLKWGLGRINSSVLQAMIRFNTEISSMSLEIVMES